MLRLLLTCLSFFGGSDWYDQSPSTDSRIIYVSQSGNDANNGLSESTPKKTISNAKTLIRSGFPDFLLLKRGDTFGPIGQWKTSGRSVDERQVISSYGQGSRPLILSGSSDGIYTLNSAGITSVDNVAVLGLEFYADTYNGLGVPSAINFLFKSDNWIIEDCKIRSYQVGILIDSYGGSKSNIRVRRNVIVDCFATTGTVGHGMYVSNCKNLLVEENLFDHNGWNTSIPGALPSIFRHNIYLNANSIENAVVRGNIISRASSHGIHFRPGGTLTDNLFIENSIAIQLGGGDEIAIGGATVSCLNNVVVGGKDIDASNPRGWGITASNIRSGLISGNLFLHNTGTFKVGMSLVASDPGVGIRNLRIKNNIWYNWGGSISFLGPYPRVKNVNLTDNIIQSTHTSALITHNDVSTADSLVIFSARNKFFRDNQSGHPFFVQGFNDIVFSEWSNLIDDTDSEYVIVPFVDPTRTIATYNENIGGNASVDDFINSVRSMSRDNWDTRLTASKANSWIRQGYTVK